MLWEIEMCMHLFKTICIFRNYTKKFLAFTKKEVTYNGICFIVLCYINIGYVHILLLGERLVKDDEATHNEDRDSNKKLRTVYV
jgi:hypothetical protein